MYNIYIFTPAASVSGGPELAHQLCHILNTNYNINAKMCYLDVTEKDLSKTFPVEPRIGGAYDMYGTEYVISAEEIDQTDSLVVIPEGLSWCINVIENAVVALWWMSVDNYISTTREENVDFLRQRVRFHLVQSKYAEEYVKRRFGIPSVYKLSDYINEEHGKFILPQEYRKNQILYNPVKGWEYIEILMRELPEFFFLPLNGLTTEKMIIIMQASKLYIDFGNHPGKERIPREAAANGCCVITNRKGSANYFEDVPIMDIYKIDDPIVEIERFKNLVYDIYENYDVHFKNFEEYRKWIKTEKERFILEVKGFVELISSI